MPTTVTSKIGATNIPVTMDYSTLQAWEDACPANLVTDDKIWRGECYNQGEFTVAGTVLTIAGQTTDATRYVELTTATGASFRDNVNVLTNSLKYNSSNGVAIKNTSGYSDTIAISPNAKVSNLQISTGTSGISRVVGGFTKILDIRNCIIESRSTHSSHKALQCYGAGSLAINILIYSTVSASGVGLVLAYGSGAYGCTIVTCSDKTQSPGYAFQCIYATGTIKNCTSFNFANFVTGTGTGSNNATDLSSVGFGTSNQTSLTFTSQFEGTTSSAPDFRVKSTSSLKNGTRDTTNTPTDILGRYRSGISPTIGCWEYIAAALPVPGGGSYYWYDGRVVISLQKGTQLTGGEKYWYDGCVVLELSTAAFVPSTLLQKPIIVQQSVNRSNTY